MTAPTAAVLSALSAVLMLAMRGHYTIDLLVGGAVGVVVARWEAPCAAFAEAVARSLGWSPKVDTRASHGVVAMDASRHPRATPPPQAPSEAEVLLPAVPPASNAAAALAPHSPVRASSAAADAVPQLLARRVTGPDEKAAGGELKVQGERLTGERLDEQDNDGRDDENLGVNIRGRRTGHENAAKIRFIYSQIASTFAMPFEIE